MTTSKFKLPRLSICTALPAILLASSAQAALVISTDPTQNVSCAGGVCSATAADAVLNVTDLTTMLASAPLTIQSGSQAQDIQVEAPFSWTSSNALTLDSYRAITVDKPVSDAGPAALTITTNDGGAGGDLYFSGKGNVKFWSTLNILTINRLQFVLVSDIASLASDASSNPSGNFALTADYNANKDGKYNSAPIQGGFSGVFEGLGHKIAHLSLFPARGQVGSLFGYLNAGGVLRDVGISPVRIVAQDYAIVGSLVGRNYGSVFNSYASGKITAGESSEVGGLVGENFGTISHAHADIDIEGGIGSELGGLASMISSDSPIIDSYSSGKIESAGSSGVGGLVAFINGPISQSFSSVHVIGGQKDVVGGLIANNSGSVDQSYATGDVFGGVGTKIGGLIGGTGSTTTESYSTGRVQAALSAYSDQNLVGGTVGYDFYSNGFDRTFWDLDTSGISDPSHGAGNIKSDPGITGLTDAQFKSGLPAGFDPNVWAEDPNINNGYPYLIANPPQK